MLSRLLRIQQEGTYEDYLKKFEIYSAPLPNTAEDVLEQVFLNGLSPEIRVEVKSRHPVGLDQCMKEAQAVRDRNIALKLGWKEMGLECGTTQTGGMTKSSKKPTETTTKNVVIPDKGDPGKKETPYWRLTDAEAKEKRDKGLCFRCDERYFRGHKCKSKEKRELNLLIAHEEEEGSKDGDLPAEEAQEVKIMEVTDNVEVALRSILGFSAKGTMKLKGIVAGKEVVVMIDHAQLTISFIKE